MKLDTFLSVAAEGRVIPVHRELSADTLTPVTAFLRLRRGEEPAFLLESVEGGERLGRFSFLGRDPFLRLAGSGEETTVEVLRPQSGLARVLGGAPGTRRERASFLDRLQEVIGAFANVEAPGLPPLTGGAVGYIGYDGVRWIERIADRHERDSDLPDAQFHFYDTLIAFDHAKHRVHLIANVLLSRGASRAEQEAAHAEAQGRLDALEESLERPLPREELPRLLTTPAPESVERGMRSSFTREEFEAAVLRAKEHIAAGDAFQIVLSQRFETDVTVKPFDVYRSLRALNPSPYLFFLQWKDTALFGSSPETMVRVEGGKAMVRPIAGTRRRGVTEEEDRQLEEELLADEKELAEHRMLVDLGRNDIGRVARFGSVKVTRLEVIERYSHVMHIVSEVEGKLRDGLTAVDAFRASFPAGTVSGAPKIRAMEIIDELEPTRRGVYAGAVGYLDFAGNLDTCIAIRTFLFHKGKARLQAGAGLVADSVPEREYLETIHKASALYLALRAAEAWAGAGRAGSDGSGGRAARSG